MQSVPQSPTRHFFSLRAKGVETLRGRNIVKAYPNPTNDIFNIAWDFSCAGQGNVELFDITGRLVLQKEFNCNSGRCELSMHNFPSGLYTYKLSVGAAMYTGKLSKHD